jgi:exo-1,4-beta-D-glucosaminidase
MLNNAWPGLIWHLYDYHLRPAGGYFGSKKALEPLHVQYSYDDRTIAIVNGKQEPFKGLKVVAKLYDASMSEKFSHEETADVAADGVVKSFAIPEPAGITPTYFLSLQLFSSAGELISRNFYWLSLKPDVLDFSKSEWYYTPQSDFADYTSLEDLPRAKLNTYYSVNPEKEDVAAFVTVENPGKGLALAVRLRLLKGKDGTEILPAFWDDNYFELLPGEKRTVTVKIRKIDLPGVKPVVAVDGFNVTPEIIE